MRSADRAAQPPRWLAIAGALLALLGGLVAVAAFSTVQANGVRRAPPHAAGRLTSQTNVVRLARGG